MDEVLRIVFPDMEQAVFPEEQFVGEYSSHLKQ
jgi:hypothetical protein